MNKQYHKITRKFKTSTQLLDQPGGHGRLPGHKPFTAKPQRCLTLTVLGAVTAVHHIATNLNCKVTTNGSRLRLQRIRGSNQLSC